MDAPHQTRDVLAESPGGAALGWVFWDGQLNPVDGMTQSWFSNATPMFFVHLTRVMIDFVSIWHDQLQLNGAGMLQPATKWDVSSIPQKLDGGVKILKYGIEHDFTLHLPPVALDHPYD
jgi:hypothetical protein